MKIKKTRLLQIIQEEIARIDEVKVVRRGRKEKELDLYDRWQAGDEDAFTELYTKIKPEIVLLLKKKGFKTIDGQLPEDIVQNVFLNLIQNLNSYGGRAALSSYLKGNAINAAIDGYRRVLNIGGGVTSTGEVTQQSDAAQKEGDPGFYSLPTGSDFPNPERETIRKDAYNKLQKDNPTVAKVVKYTIMGYGQNKIAELNNMTQKELGKFFEENFFKISEEDLKYLFGLGGPKSQAAVSRALEHAEDKFIEYDKVQEGLTKGETAKPEMGLDYLNDLFSDMFKEIHNVRPGFRFRSEKEAEGAIEDLMNYEDAEYQGMPEDPNADLKKSNPYDHYEDLPKQEPMGPRNEAKSLEETIAAVVKETLGL